MSSLCTPPMRALVTRPRAEAEALAALLAARGIETVIEPLIEIAAERGGVARSGMASRPSCAPAPMGCGRWRRPAPNAGCRSSRSATPPRRGRGPKGSAASRAPAAMSTISPIWCAASAAASREAVACRRQRRCRRSCRGASRRKGSRSSGRCSTRRSPAAALTVTDGAIDRRRRVRFRAVLFAAHRGDLRPPGRGSGGRRGPAPDGGGVDQRGGRRDAGGSAVSRTGHRRRADAGGAGRLHRAAGGPAARGAA